jgi:hypothetical protein
MSVVVNSGGSVVSLEEVTELIASGGKAQTFYACQCPFHWPSPSSVVEGPDPASPSEIPALTLDDGTLDQSVALFQVAPSPSAPTGTFDPRSDQVKARLIRPTREESDRPSHRKRQQALEHRV